MTNTLPPVVKPDDMPSTAEARLATLSPNYARLIRNTLVRHRATLEELAKR